MEIFDTDTGLPVLVRSLHILAGIAWIGLLYYFNVVQVPAFAQYGDEGRARNIAIDKVARRALWWFRWAAMSTLVLGLLITGVTKDYWKDFFKFDNGLGAYHSTILIGMLLGITMAANVWMVIWPAQKVVLANAANVVAGGEADPAAPAAGRKALLASRQNTLFSISMLWFMVGSGHLYGAQGGLTGAYNVDSSGKVWVFILISVVICAALELAALGYIGGTANTNKLLWPYENHKNTIISGAVLWAVLYILSEILLKS